MWSDWIPNIATWCFAFPALFLLFSTHQGGYIRMVDQGLMWIWRDGSNTIIIRVFTSLLHESSPSELGGDTNLPTKKIIRYNWSHFYCTSKGYFPRCILFKTHSWPSRQNNQNNNSAKIFSGNQACKWWVKKRFIDLLCLHHQGQYQILHKATITTTAAIAPATTTATSTTVAVTTTTMTMTTTTTSKKILYIIFSSSLQSFKSIPTKFLYTTYLSNLSSNI